MIRIVYEKEIKVNDKTGQEYVYLRPKRTMGMAISPAPFEAMSQAKVGLGMAVKETWHEQI